VKESFVTRNIYFANVRAIMRRIIISTLACLIFIGIPASIPAQEGEKPDPLANQSALEIIVVASEGMAVTIKEGTKLDVVRKALDNAIKFIPKETHIALRVSGHRISKDQEEQSCADSELLITPSLGNLAKISSKLAAIKPLGKRSVVRSLSLALADLAPYGGTKTLLLITDGNDTCLKQDPIAYLAPASLKNQGYIIHIRGIGVDKTAAEALKTIAEGTGGSFAAADDAFSFSQQISIATQKGATASEKKAAPTEKKAAPTEKEATPTEKVVEKDTITKPAIPPTGTAATPLPLTGRADAAVKKAIKAEAKKVEAAPKPPPFDPNELVKKFVKEMKKVVTQAIEAKPKVAPKPPPPPKTFSKESLLIIAVETLLLVLAFAVIILLILRQRRE
jgi:hypothetical protein